jgi:hypothetical protein
MVPLSSPLFFGWTISLMRKIIGTKLELTMTITIIMMIPDVDHNN